MTWNCATDFGLSNFVSGGNHNNNDNSENNKETSRMPNELCVTQCGSPAYAAPELLNNNKYGSKVDIWSMYAIYNVINLASPFKYIQ